MTASPSSTGADNVNKLISDMSDIVAAVASDDLLSNLKELNYNWNENSFSENGSLSELLQRHGYTFRDDDSRLRTTQTGRLFLSRLLIHFGALPKNQRALGSLQDKFKDFEYISTGKNSVVLKAKHKLINTPFIIKIVRPGASENLANSIGRLGEIQNDSAIVKPIDLIRCEICDLIGNSLTIECLIFPYIEGQTFREFLAQKNNHLNSQLAITFVKQVGQALLELENIGAYHGDLHEQNLLVDNDTTYGLKFKIIDISFDAMGSTPMQICKNSDLTNFKQHIWRILSIQKARIPNISIRKYIGIEQFNKITKILSDDVHTFSKVVQINTDENAHKAFMAQRDEFLNQHFRQPGSFRLQRYEEITDPEVAIRLFVPFPELMQRITHFANTYVSGNRGSGKSTYLAALSFFATPATSLVDHAKIFGIYFPCRQGEFRPLASRPIYKRAEETQLVTRIMIIKVVRRTLEALASGIRSKRLTAHVDLSKLKTFVDLVAPAPGVLTVDNDLQSEIDNYVATMVRIEMDEVRLLQEGTRLERTDLRPDLLINFFKAVQETFYELSETRFHILFDDAGEPYVPRNVQRIINDFILTSNPIFCVKFAAEKFTFTFENSQGKIIENGHDYFEHDISSILFIGSGTIGQKRATLEDYFSQIVRQRLEYFGFSSSNIVNYIGDDASSYRDLLFGLSRSKKNAYYHGWTTVWNIADRTPRNLLEIVAEIFSVANITPSSTPRVISPRAQNRAIRTISEKRLDSLSQISGAIQINGRKTSLGRRLFEVTAAIGSVFRRYLVASPGNRQTLAIERNDLDELPGDAEAILKQLVSFGVLDSTRLAYAMDDKVKKPIYVLNRIYCPAFGIGYTRDDHLRLSKGKFATLLLDPEKFLREGTTVLRKTEASEQIGDLFDYKNF